MEESTIIEQLKAEIGELKAQLKLQNEAHNEEISILRTEINDLKTITSRNSDKIMVQSRVNEALSAEVDRLEQYGRRNCILLKGIPASRNEKNADLTDTVKKILSEDLKLSAPDMKDFDKTHRIGPAYRDKRGNLHQSTIVRFKSHEARYKAYLNRAKLKTKGMNLSPSLTNKRRKLLASAKEKYADNKEIDFIFCDIHGDLKIKLTEPVNEKHFHVFHSNEDIQWLLHELSEQVL